jgi:hypothetical protein
MLAAILDFLSDSTRKLSIRCSSVLCLFVSASLIDLAELVDDVIVSSLLSRQHLRSGARALSVNTTLEHGGLMLIDLNDVTISFRLSAL